MSVNLSEHPLGTYSKGKRNQNGQALIEFCIQNNLFINNSAFKHKSCHITTWQGQFKDPSTNSTHKIYNQIDFIITQFRHKNVLKDARSYAGTLVSSDHRLVICNTNINPYYNTKSTIKAPPKLDLEKLLNTKTRHKFQVECNKLLITTTPSAPPKEQQSNLTRVLTEAARNTLPVIPRSFSTKPCPIIQEFVEKQKELRLQYNNCNDDNKKRALKQKRNQIQHKIRNQVLENASKKIDAIAEKIESTPVGHKMFKAIKYMKRGPKRPITISKEKGSLNLNSSHFRVIS